jgi:lipoprotein-anchoring transpeptidase ErfK/SrfK
MRALASAALACLLCTACGAELSQRETGSPPASVQGGGEPAKLAAAPSCQAGVEERLGSRRRAYAAAARGRVVAFRRPGGRPVRTFAPRNVNGVTVVFGVLGVVRDERCAPAWYRVQLPVRPNGSTGYVHAGDVSLSAVRTRIEVDLSGRRVAFFRDGRLVLRAKAGIGSGATPTPTGRYYVNQRLLARDPTGPWGPGGIGVSAFSPVLQSWAQGGPIAIHGTNDPSSIGRAVTFGCLRIRNAQVARMLYANPEGTPVVIRS